MTIILNKETPIDEIEQGLRHQNILKKVNIMEFVGSIKLKKDPMKIQNELRNEWQ